MLLADSQIRRLSLKVENPMITPFASGEHRKGVISYGVTSYGYDARLGNDFKVFNNKKAGIINPKDIDPDLFEIFSSADPVIIPGNSFALARTFEWFSIPRDIQCQVIGKSTYARCGLIVNVTPLEPEWRGKITMELSNTTPNPMTVFPNEGICQVIFLRGDICCDVSYADKKGKYQDQKGLQLPLVLKD